AVPWLQKHLPPAAPPDADKVRQLLTDLGSDKFAVRAKAEKELLHLGDLAAPALEQALAGKPPLELRRRAELILASLKDGAMTNAALLRSLRAVEILERIGNDEARQVLARLAKGTESRQTREARQALERLRQTNP